MRFAPRRVANPEPEASASAPAAIEIGREDLVTVSRAEISVGPLVSGELRAAREATVRAEVSGSVLQVSAEEGQSVRQGTLLARIEDQTLREAVASAQSDVRSTELSLEVAQRELHAPRRSSRRARWLNETPILLEALSAPRRRRWMRHAPGSQARASSCPTRPWCRQ